MKNINEKLGVAAIVLGILFVTLLVATPIIIEKTKASVIQELKSYSPGPYGPGFNPDKVDPSFFNDSEQQPTGQRVWLGSWESQRFESNGQ
ncbi:MAG: hypothetical protein ACW99G_03165 [Candidatus Thorarchaeota archaeon]|jgi:hypothetical protein